MFRSVYTVRYVDRVSRAHVELIEQRLKHVVEISKRKG
jgi:hypothetical protein